MTQQDKKPLPFWLKFGIAALALLVILSTLISIGVTLLGGLLSKEGTNLAKKGLEKVLEQQARLDGKSIDVDINKDGFSLKDKKSGEKFNFRTNKKIPDSFPKQITVPAPLKLSGSVVAGQMSVLTFEGDITHDDVVTYYERKLSSLGWHQNMKVSSQKNQSSLVYKKDKEQLSIGIDATRKTTQVTLTHMRR